ncbi:MAG: apolipoprotein N-acyltransferase [Cyanobacteria bacterium Co-bin13]|nr:apolipoprotein N-acyltransferase [Cyanobacteria bacterium Co-bin13]
MGNVIDLQAKSQRGRFGLTVPLSWKTVLLAMGSGLLMSLATPPLGLWPLAWFSLIPLWGLILASREQSWRAVFAYGVIWGVGFHGSVLSWITHLHPLTWMGVPWLGSVAIAAFAWSFVTLWGAVTVGFWAVGLHSLSRLKNVGPGLRVSISALLWCLLEQLRNYTPLDWSALALTQSPHNLVILHLAQLSGQLLVAAVLVGFNGLLAEAWWALYSQPAVVGLGHRVKPLVAGAIALLVSAHALGAVLFTQGAADTPASAVSIGLIQGNVPTRIKLTTEGVRRAMEGYTEGYKALVAQGADAVLTPEGAVPAIWDVSVGQTNALVQATEAAGVPLWLGTFATNSQQSNRLTQSLLEIDGSSRVTGRYNKVQLVPLGEYLPLEPILGRLIGRLSPLDNYLVPGEPEQQFTTRLGSAIVGICYESAYSWLFREQARNGGEFILTASNNDPYPPRMMIQHHALDVIRAIESDRWAVRATNTGLSGIVDPQGRTLWLATPGTYTTHLATLYRRQTTTPYVRWGSWSLLILWSLGSALIFIQRDKSNH